MIIFWILVVLAVVYVLMEFGAWTERMNPYSSSNLLLDDYEEELSYYKDIDEENNNN